MLGSLKPDEIEQVLHTATVGRIGCHCEGLTYIVPVTFTYDGQRVIAHSAEGMKIQMMRSNPSVCFQVDQIDAMTDWRSVVLWGRFRELEGLEAAQAMGLLVERLKSTPISRTAPHPPPESKIKAVVYEILVNNKTGRFESN
jgi:nitroimidazol reductase NimA-like FMN-containing flavoprotein (pyridoxamine 5'-phosphate oxidase superfamily)